MPVVRDAQREAARALSLVRRRLEVKVTRDMLRLNLESNECNA